MKLTQVFNNIMRQRHRQAVLLGGASASSADQFFGFSAKDVKAIHVHKDGVGDGIWFRLHCGRVFDEIGTLTCRDVTLYDFGMAA